jgi:hypothetical protein
LTFIFNGQNINHFDALIDAGGLIIQNSVMDIVNKLYEKMQSPDIIKKIILFVDINDELYIKHQCL